MKVERCPTLDAVSDQIRRGEPVGFLGAIAAINYQAALREEKKYNSLRCRLARWFRGIIK